MKKSYFVYAGIIISCCVIPIIASAQGYQDVTSGLNAGKKIVDGLNDGIVKSLATLFLSLGLVAFFWGIVQYVWARRNGDAKGLEEGNKSMTWGLVALFVMFSVYGIIKLAQGVIGVKDVTTISIPSFDFKQGNSSGPQGNTTGLPTGGGAPSQSPNMPSGGNGQATNCENFINGTSCTTPSGTAGSCGDMGNGTRGCITGGSSGAQNNAAPTLNGCTQANIGSTCTKTTGGTGTCQASDTEYLCQ